MAMSLFSLSVCVLLLFHGCVAQQGQWQQHRPDRDPSECRIQSLSAQEPNRRIESEAGVTEFWNENNEQFQCAGVAACRHVIQPKGLVLPAFANAPMLVYVVQGRGIHGAIFPGCPETYQSVQQSQQSEEGRGQRSRDQHQKIRQLRQGDIIAMPNGVAHWFYNDGETPLVVVGVLDTSNNANQLDRRPRKFFLAGNPQQQGQQQGHQQGQQQGRPAYQPSYRPSYQKEQESSGNNIFTGFDVQTLAEAFGVSTETARKLQSQNDNRGHIVRVENGLQVIRPPRREEEEEREQQGRGNGLEETLCSMRLMENIADPTRADVYNPQGGRIRSLNSQKLPILNYLQLSAERGVLYRNAILAPQWNMNAHSVVYVTRGSGRIQVVGNSQRAVYDGELRQGQILIIPQNFAVVKQAGNDGFEWVAIKTNDNAMSSPLVGRFSAMRGMPEDILMNSYRISREDARRLKYNREEMVVFAPRSGGRASA